MITMEQIKERQKQLSKAEYALLRLERIDAMLKLLESPYCNVVLHEAINTDSNYRLMVSTVLNDQEQAVLVKGIHMTLEFAKQRIEKEIEKI